VGARYVIAKNTYTGDIADISVITPGGTVRADTYMNTLAATVTGYATSATNAGNGMQPLIDGGAGTLTFAQAETATAINATQRAQLEGGLLAFGFTQTQIDAMTLAQAQASYYGTATNLNGQAVQLTGGAALMGDQSADVVQKGTGICPILGLNLSLLEDKLNIGVKYEFKTSMDVTNETPVGKGFIIGMTALGQPIEMFPDGAKTNADIPAMLSVGVNYKFTDKFSAQVGYHNYFDKGTGWSVIEGSNPEISKIDKNFWELALGLEYAINDKLLVSCGYLNGMTGVNAYFDSDLAYSLNSSTVGLGGVYKINDMLGIEIGGYNTWYKTTTITNPTSTAYSQTYKKSNIAFAIGLDFNFGGK
jgi:long-chain fatty acid transport protein